MANSKSTMTWYKNPLWLLVILFVVLRIAGVIDWPVWLLFSPILGPLAFIAGLSLLVWVAQLIGGLYRLVFWSKERRAQHKNVKNLIKALEAYATAFAERNS
jgi:hypothetical protein